MLFGSDICSAAMYSDQCSNTSWDCAGLKVDRISGGGEGADPEGGADAGASWVSICLHILSDCSAGIGDIAAATSAGWSVQLKGRN